MSDKTSELFNTFTDYYERLSEGIAADDDLVFEETVDFVKRFCNIERLEVDIAKIWDEGCEAYAVEVFDHSELPVSEWSGEQHAVWQAFRCACYSEDAGYRYGVEGTLWALVRLFTSASK